MKNKKLTIFIDSCAWNILFKNNINLAEEFNCDEIDWAMTKEVYSYEIEPTPYKELKDYIKQQIVLAPVREDSFFGFSSYDDLPDYKPRVSGFGEGRWATVEEFEQMNKFELAKEKIRKTGLYNNEADTSMAVGATSGGIVLTAENPNKKGPLKNARLKGGKIIDISEFDSKKFSFRNFINERLELLFHF